MPEHVITRAKNSIEKRLIKVISDWTDIPEDEITPESHLKNDLHLDSLDQVELEMGIEKEFNILIPMDRAVTQQTVQDFIDDIEGDLIITDP